MKGDLAVALEDFLQVPHSRSERPFTRINQLTHAGDGSGRLFVGDMSGFIYVIESGELLSTAFLDLHEARGEAVHYAEFEKGLLSFAFHPDFGRPGSRGFGKLYTATTEEAVTDVRVPAIMVFAPPSGTARHQVVIAEWQVAQNGPPRVDVASRREVMRIGFRHNDHQVGRIAFSPNAAQGDDDYGQLYIPVGDGGDTAKWTSEVDVDRQGQNAKTPFGAILRIDPLGEGEQSYGVPLGNLFFLSDDFVLPEIWAYGLRNPQHFSWDTGGRQAMYIADIGQANIEEINIGIAGGNYGWSEREGTFAVHHRDQSQLRSAHADENYIAPIAQYDHDEGLAVAGGYVYRGRRIPDLLGKYVFGDIVNGRVFYIDADRVVDGRQSRIRELRLFHRGVEMSLLAIIGDATRADLRFGRDEEGELYILTKQDGVVRRIVPFQE